MAFYFVSTFANAQTPTKQRPYGYRGLKIITSLRLRFHDFQRLGMQFLLLSRAASTRRISELPCRLSGTKNHHFAKLRFHDFQRWCPVSWKRCY
ncbi:hypothetical protein [Bathymodiolus japonicus methanotrophic gill symbiont]|uniref:hypothetical protein n=1 Tax=Bathymodiolus japonicus methanotrophic gill symbiont TaxID=113269 RepID=UPI001C8D8DAD|nr:hypothetical protein [Bathymodiolus japonicus methanotrophic gill symbiont]